MDAIVKIFTNRRGIAGVVTGVMALLGFTGYIAPDEASVQAAVTGVLDTFGAAAASGLALWSLFQPRS